MDYADVSGALSAGRRAVEDYVIRRRRQGNEWKEEMATEILCMAASPPFEYIEFNRRQEGVVGADWLWWWIDDTGECFGMLVQAKKLHRRPNGWFVDFRYPGGTGSQMMRLFDAADVLEVPPVYMLFAGDVGYRAGLQCGSRHSEPDCRRCEEACVSILAALAARDVVSWSACSYPGRSAIDAFHESSPLEDLADPDKSRTLALDLNLRNVGVDLATELRDFARSPQAGARQIAKAILAQLSRMRTRQFSAAGTAQLDMASTMVFDRLPADRGHFGVPYFTHVLRGLRTAAPDYVSDLALGRPPPTSVSDLVAGIVIVHI